MALKKFIDIITTAIAQMGCGCLSLSALSIN